MGLSETDAGVLDNLFDDRQEVEIFSSLLKMAQLNYPKSVKAQACFIRSESVRVLAEAAIAAAETVSEMTTTAGSECGTSSYVNPVKVPPRH